MIIDFNPLLFITSQVTLAEDGMKGLVKGWGPTLAGYSAQVKSQSGPYSIQSSNYLGLSSNSNPMLTFNL